jgi:hypothetical protein
MRFDAHLADSNGKGLLLSRRRAPSVGTESVGRPWQRWFPLCERDRPHTLGPERVADTSRTDPRSRC